jgi:hypothetical protein
MASAYTDGISCDMHVASWSGLSLDAFLKLTAVSNTSPLQKTGGTTAAVIKA